MRTHILGSGVDLVGVERVERAVARHGEELFGEFLRPSEIDRFQQFHSRGSWIARAFAAKEAFFKALGAGRTGALTWRDVELLAGPGEAPSLRVTGEAARLASAMGVERIHLGLTADAGQATAWVVLEGRPGREEREETF